MNMGHHVPGPPTPPAAILLEQGVPSERDRFPCDTGEPPFPQKASPSPRRSSQRPLASTIIDKRSPRPGGPGTLSRSENTPLRIKVPIMTQRFRVIPTCAVFLLTVACFPRPQLLAADDDPVPQRITLERTDVALRVLIDGGEFTVLHFAANQKKPYFWPVRAADGTILTRPIEPGEKEHPHHKGIWISVDEVNHSKHWVEKEVIRNKSVDGKINAAGNAVLQIENDWLNGEGTPLLHESTEFTITPDRLIVAKIRLRMIDRDVTFGDTKEGMFGLRIAQSMRELKGGRVIGSTGLKTAAANWGKPAGWIDYTGEVNGKTYGVTLMDSPQNFRPSRYHVRDYGLFTLSPFGEGAYQDDAKLAQPVALNDSRPELTLTYGLVVHTGELSPAELQELYGRFTKLMAAEER